MSVRVRFAPSPTGSLHLGNALTAVANRDFADAHGGVVVLRIDDTDPARTVAGGEEAILRDLAWLEVAFDEGPVRQSERGALYDELAETALASGAAERDADGSVRLARGGTTLLRPDGTATYQLASVADDLALGITHVIRGSDHRPNLEVQQRIARALGGELPEVLHHGLVLGPDGKKLSKRHGHSSVDELREEGFPAAAVRAYLDELGLPAHDVQLDLARLRRLAVDAIAALPDEELAAAADAPSEVVPALRGARTLVEARGLCAPRRRAGGRRPRRRREADARAVRRAPGASSGLALRRRRAGRRSRAEGGRRRSALAPAGADRARTGGPSSQPSSPRSRATRRSHGQPAR